MRRYSATLVGLTCLVVAIAALCYQAKYGSHDMMQVTDGARTRQTVDPRSFFTLPTFTFLVAAVATGVIFGLKFDAWVNGHVRL